jgi:hypothetical protein
LSPKAQLRAVVSERSRLRQDLVKAIATRDAAIEERDQTINAIDRAQQIVVDCRHDLERAEIELAQAKVTVADRIAASARAGAKPAVDRTLREARLRHADAEDELSAAKDALAQLEGGTVEEHQRILDEAEDVVRQCALAVIGSETNVPHIISDLRIAPCPLPRTQGTP